MLSKQGFLLVLVSCGRQGLEETARLCADVTSVQEDTLIVTDDLTLPDAPLRIINIGSVVAKAGYVDQSLYSASKHALLGMTQAVARDLGPDGIRVHAVLPGGVNTAMVGDVRPDIDTSELISPDEVAETVIFRMIEDGRLSLETPLASILSAETLNGLFVLGGTDYRDLVTGEQLLGHTSGVADYFSGIVGGRGREYGRVHSRRQRFTDRVINESDHLWTPAELLAYSRDKQKPVAPPGERFHYSDSGYVLLGMTAETIDGASFGGVLDRWVFEPAGMTQSRLAFDSTGSSGAKVSPRRTARRRCPRATGFAGASGTTRQPAARL